MAMGVGFAWSVIPTTWKVGLIVGAIGLVVASYEAFTWKIAHDAVQVERVRVEKEKVDEINKATEARNRLRDLCERAPTNCVPDEWFRN
jgi:uncharacterized membrane protein